MASFSNHKEKTSSSSGEEMELDYDLKKMADFYPPENIELEKKEPIISKKVCYKLKKHPLMFASILHLSFIKMKNIPIFCAPSKDNNGNYKRFGRSAEGSTNGKDKIIRLTCKIGGRKRSFNMTELKAYLIDLYNHKRLYITENNHPSKKDGRNHYLLHFTKDGENFESFEFESPSEFYSSDIENPLYTEPLMMGIQFMQQKKGLTLSGLREIFYSEYDYMKPGEENNESAYSLFYDITDTDLPDSVPSHNATRKNGNPNKKIKVSSNTFTVDYFLQKNNVLENGSPQPLESFDVGDINNILKENYNLKVQLSNLQFKIYEQGLIFESMKSSSDSRIDKMINQLKNIDSELSKMKQKKPTYASVAAKANKDSNANAIVEHKRKMEDIKAQTNERITKKLKTFETNIQSSKDSLPEGVKKVLDSENGMEKIKNAMMSLSTRPEKESKANDLTRVYVEGIQRQKIGKLRATLKGIGIINSMLSNISFLKKATCEIVVYKSYKEEFLKLFKAFPEAFEILENFDPIKCLEENPTLENINKTEKAFYNRVHGIISRKQAPDIIKDFFLKVLEETDFKTINSIDGEILPSYKEKLQQNENSEMDIDHEKDNDEDNEEDNEEDIEDYIENDDFILPEDPAQEISTSGNHPGESTTKNNKVNNLDNYFVKEKNPIKDKASTSTLANEEENVEILVPCTDKDNINNGNGLPETQASNSTIVPETQGILATERNEHATLDNSTLANKTNDLQVYAYSTDPKNAKAITETQASGLTIIQETQYEHATEGNVNATNENENDSGIRDVKMKDAKDTATRILREKKNASNKLKPFSKTIEQKKRETKRTQLYNMNVAYRERGSSNTNESTSELSSEPNYISSDSAYEFLPSDEITDPSSPEFYNID